jgi:hypothetical protein
MTPAREIPLLVRDWTRRAKRPAPARFSGTARELWAAVQGAFAAASLGPSKHTLASRNPPKGGVPLWLTKLPGMLWALSVYAATKSEARARMKEPMGLGRLPAGLVLEKVEGGRAGQ